MSDVWICTLGDKTLAVRCLTVVTAYEVRQFAAKKFGADPASIDVKPSTDGVPSGDDAIEVQWTGNDFSHGGATGCRRLQERALGAAEWADS